MGQMLSSSACHVTRLLFTVSCGLRFASQLESPHVTSLVSPRPRRDELEESKRAKSTRGRWVGASNDGHRRSFIPGSSRKIKTTRELISLPSDDKCHGGTLFSPP